MINDRNGFGNDQHTEVYVNSPTIVDTASFTDLSYRRAEVTNYNGVSSSSSQHLWINASLMFSGYTDQYISTPLVSPIGKNDFCIDFWVNVSSDTGSPFTDVFAVGFFKATGHPLLPDYNNYCGVRIDYTYGDLIFEYISGGTTAFSCGGSNFRYDAGRWNHISAVRFNQNDLRIFVNGTEVSRNIIVSVVGVDLKNLDYQMMAYHRSSAARVRNFFVDVWRHSSGHYRWKNDFIVPNRFY